MKRVNFRPIRRALCLLLCLGVLLAAAPPARAGTAGSLSLSTGSVSQGGSVTLRLRAEHKPVFLTMLYVIHRAVNRVPELRRRIEDGQVVEYDECPVSFTELKPDGSYAYCRMETARIRRLYRHRPPAAGGGPAGRHH